ncbi:MAG: glutamyl-tRNA reductase, partial [Bacillota bacterium]|nr:glutamyl-tRNA reductase [Bacillota bacterium]
MDIAVIGLNHRTAGAEIRERAAFTDVKKIEIINSLLDRGLDEVVIVSTCNRSEIYIAAPEEKLEQQVEVVREQYEGLLEEAARDKYLYIKIGHDA